MKVFIIGNEDNYPLGFSQAAIDIRKAGDTPINIYAISERLEGFTVADLAAVAFELIRISDAVMYIDEKLDFLAALERGKARGDKKPIYNVENVSLTQQTRNCEEGGCMN